MLSDLNLGEEKTGLDIARAAQVELKLTPKQVFRHQTIADSTAAPGDFSARVHRMPQPGSSHAVTCRRNQRAVQPPSTVTILPVMKLAAGLLSRIAAP